MTALLLGKKLATKIRIQLFEPSADQGPHDSHDSHEHGEMDAAKLTAGQDGLCDRTNDESQ